MNLIMNELHNRLRGGEDLDRGLQQEGQDLPAIQVITTVVQIHVDTMNDLIGVRNQGRHQVLVNTHPGITIEGHTKPNRL
jgi:hypothetical protein